MVWTLTCVNLATPFQKAIDCGFVSACIFRKSEKPHYHAGMTDGLILTGVALLLTGCAWIYLVVHNRKKARGGHLFTYRA